MTSAKEYKAKVCPSDEVLPCNLEVQCWNVRRDCSCSNCPGRSKNFEKLLLASSCLIVRPVSLCLSVRPHCTTRLPLHGFSRNFYFKQFFVTLSKRLRWSRGSVLAFGTQVRGFKPGRSRRIFQGEKILLRRGSKAVGPMSQIYGM